MIKRLIRVVIAALGCAVGYGVFSLVEFMGLLTGLYDLGSAPGDLWHNVAAAVCAVVFGVAFFFLTPVFGRQSARVAKGIETDLKAVPINDMIAGTGGLVIGLVIAFLISQVFVGLPAYIGLPLSIVTYVLTAYLGIVIATRKGKDLIFGWIAPARAGGSRMKGKGHFASPKILDTSAIIDGRIADIMKTGFIEGNMVIPEFVLVELRHIADSSDGLKRNRGRRGLDVLNRLQTEYGIEIYNTETDKALEEIPEVDVKLLKLAQILHGKVLTNDFNLNKVAMIKGIEVLNINELANTLKPVVLPGEDMTLFLVKEGKESNQAIAYLDDGTMIVVEDGRRHIGNNIGATVTSVLQTSSGRMIFAKPRAGGK
ncbi:MAG: PIN domain nuclease [Clostridiales Family XIII bacterium]|nr:PIN domain nuclease [Clostridiales Family XIII bacterium]